MLDEMILAFNKSKSTPNELSGSETELFDSLTIQLPENFNQLSEESIKERYAFESRPAIVYTECFTSRMVLSVLYRIWKNL